MRATTMTSLPLALAALVCAGCNPSDFDSLLDQAPVVSFTPEGPSTGSLFVLPLPPPSEPGTTAAARMLVSRKDTDFLGIADFDSNGKVKLHKASQGDLDSLGSSVYSAAVRSDGTILVGMPRYGATGGVNAPAPPGRASLINPTPDGNGGYTLNIQGGPQGGTDLPHLGISVAKGYVTGQAMEDFVILGDNTVQVLDALGRVYTLDPTDLGCTTLNLTGSTTDPYAFRPVVVGDVLAGGLDEIVVSSQGAVRFLQWNDAKKALSCPTQTLTMSAQVSFGSSLAVGDFDGNSQLDLAVGAPLDKVYVFFGPLDTVTGPSVTLTNSGATGFGERIASFHAPGAQAAQLLVGDRSNTAAGGPEGGGRVMLFSILGSPPQLSDRDAVVTLFDSSSDNGQQEFGGTNLGGLLFNTGVCVPGGGMALVPWASTNHDVLTFFNHLRAPSDPRCFAINP